jgi:hypothetical protein
MKVLFTPQAMTLVLNTTRFMLLQKILHVLCNNHGKYFGTNIYILLTSDRVVRKVTLVFNRSNVTLISSKTERRDLHITNLYISLSNCNTVHVIRKRSCVCRSMKYSSKMVELAGRYIRHILWSYEFLYYISSTPILDRILRCLYPIPHNIFKIHFNIILLYLQPGPSNSFVPRGFPTKILHSLTRWRRPSQKKFCSPQIIHYLPPRCMHFIRHLSNKVALCHSKRCIN